MKEVFILENDTARTKALNRFCYLTALLATPYVYILYSNDLILPSWVMLFIIALFLLSPYLSIKGYHNYSRLVVVFDTNFAVAYFSVLLGFDSGIHLYLFSAPLITYLLYDFSEKIKIRLTSSTYVLNFIIVYLVYKLNAFAYVVLDEKIHHILYFMNFAFSLTLCFFLIIYFANNNSFYIRLLRDANQKLETNQIQLQNEILEKNGTHKMLSETLREKETLLSEIHHRVKNNLAVISGLLELQNFYVKDEGASGILKESRNRIKSIALLHEKLYESKSLDTIEIRSYVEELVNYIKLSFSNDKKEIIIHSRLDDIKLPMEEALPFSLMVNELITNSYKHAFKDKDRGNVYLTFEKTNEGYVFDYKDDGCGFDASENFKETSLGMNLIEAFAKQLKGNMMYISKPNEGVNFKLKFEKNTAK